jgi:SAM-dependent methyltransferase
MKYNYKKRVFEIPIVSKTFQKWACGKHSAIWAREHIDSVSTFKVLDIGCGHADIVGHIEYGEYVGLDPNPFYISTAKRKHYPNATFICADLNHLHLYNFGLFDRIVLLGVLHRLSDPQILNLLQTLTKYLTVNGKLVTCDPAIESGQSRLARFLVTHGRGEFMRSAPQYCALIQHSFKVNSSTIRHDTFRVASTQFITSSSLLEVLESTNAIKRKHELVESEIHFDASREKIHANYGAFEEQGFYEDGLFTIQYRDFEYNDSFNNAYNLAINHATSAGGDPHIRWRARVFQFFLKQRIPGKCIELGTAHGFMFYCALKKFENEGIDFSGSKIFLIDKFDQKKVDPITGMVLSDLERNYSIDAESTIKRFSCFEEVSVVMGTVPEVLTTFDTTEISFLHIDLNTAQAEVAGLKLLYESLKLGAIVLLDDYGFPNYVESRISHDQLADELGYEILSLPTGQGLIIK